jgi:hypothetical protein
MKKNNQIGLTEKNLDNLAELLASEIENPVVADLIPSGAHLFYGSHKDQAFTMDNLKLASKVLLGMAIGYIEEAPLVMVCEDKTGQKKAFDLSSDKLKSKASDFINEFHVQSQQEMRAQLDGLLAA